MRALVIAKSIEGVPQQFQVFPYGRIEVEGEEHAILDEEAMAAIIADFERRGNEMVIDYEHQTLKDVQAPAAGWVKMLVSRGKEGLWAAVEWTRRAKEYLENREYRYFSPVFWVREGDRRVVKIDNIALTNAPRINRLAPIVAKMSRQEARAARKKRAEKYDIGVKESGHAAKPSEWAEVPEEQFLDPVNYRYPCPDADQTRAAAGHWGQDNNKAQYSSRERAIIDRRLDTFRKKFNIGEIRGKEHTMNIVEKLKKLFGLAEDAGDDKIVEAAEQLTAKNRQLEAAAAGKPVVAKEVLAALDMKEGDLSQVVATIHALKQAGRGAVSREEFIKLQGELKRRDAEELVAKALSEGKITPEQREWAKAYAERDLEGFKTFAAKAPVVVPVEKLPGGEKVVSRKAEGELQLSINKMCGIDEETWKKYGPKEQAA